jgi:hypothetical protein
LHPQASASRLEFIDFLRGVAIVEMLAAHYTPYFPLVAQKVIDYTETAMALFVLLAGFMVGWGYRKFAEDPYGQSAVVWKRALRVLVIQYLMILTIGVPLYLLGIPGVDEHQSLSQFLAQSMLFLNQVGLLHILPTFIPLFVVSPVILLALSRGWDVPLLIVSLCLFAVGHFHPYLLDIGQPTIFPFVLFQLYFVAGSLLGKRTRLAGAPPPREPRRWLVAACAALLVCMLLVHGKIVPPGLISTHPLNFYGLIYHGTIIATLWLLTLVCLPRIRSLWPCPQITRFGRHALLAFVIHVYLARALGVLNYLAPQRALINYLLILVSVLVMNAIVRRYERSQLMARPPGWTRAVHALFR